VDEIVRFATAIPSRPFAAQLNNRKDTTMLNTCIKTSRHFSRWIAAVVVVALGAISVPAFAVTNPNVSRVALIAFNGPTSVLGITNSLIIQAPDGTNFYATMNAGGGCTNNNLNVDAVKIYQALAESALLSGKNVRIAFNVCGGINYIYSMDLIQ
jgi:hypothetical protein